MYNIIQVQIEYGRNMDEWGMGEYKKVETRVRERIKLIIVCNTFY